MGFDLERHLSRLTRAELRHPAMGRLEHLVWERLSADAERIQHRRVRSSVLVLTVAAAFVGGVIAGGHQTDSRSGSLLIDETEQLILPAAIN
jgi:hypothetical protein